MKVNGMHKINDRFKYMKIIITQDRQTKPSMFMSSMNEPHFNYIGFVHNKQKIAKEVRIEN